MNGYAVAVAAISYAPGVLCLSASLRMALNDKDSLAMGFGWAGAMLCLAALIPAMAVIHSAAP